MARRSARSIDVAVQAALNAAAGLPKPPAHVRLRPEDLPFWEGILRARARDEWNEASLVLAAQLARCMADIEAETLALQAERTVIGTERGPVANPRLAIVEQLSRRQMAMMRSLTMTGRAAVPDPRGLVASRRLQRDADEALIPRDDSDCLLARPGGWRV